MITAATMTNLVGRIRSKRNESQHAGEPVGLGFAFDSLLCRNNPARTGSVI